jgi:GDP-4-dehydro-6-deoxy-D-mannose reductase
MTVGAPALVTGAAGFAGSHLVDALLALGVTVEAWARPETPPVFASVDERVHWREVELLDRATVRAALAASRPAAIFHLAGAAHLGASWQHVAATLETNVMGTANLLEAERALGLGARTLVPGSATVYRESPDALTEDAPLAPASPYAVSKLAQEQLALRAAAEGQHVIVTRSFNHIGPRQAPTFASASFARQIASIEHGDVPPVLRVGNLAPRRDLTDVRDTVRAYIALLARGQPGLVYNVCSGTAPSVQEVLNGLLARVAVRVAVEIDPTLYRPHDAPIVVGDHARLTRDTGWRPVISLDTTLDDLLAFWRHVVQQDNVASRS